MKQLRVIYPFVCPKDTGGLNGIIHFYYYLTIALLHRAIFQPVMECQLLCPQTFHILMRFLLSWELFLKIGILLFCHSYLFIYLFILKP